MIRRIVNAFLFLAPSVVFSQSITLEFDHLTIYDGLSSNAVTSIIQDTSGFIWFGTYEGLNRWDGYNFETYIHNEKDSTSLSVSYINDLYFDKKGNMWIGTQYGLNKFDPVTNKFERFFAQYEDSHQHPYNCIYEILEDTEGIIWCGTEYGLCKLDSSGKLFHYIPNRNNSSILSPNRIFSLCQIDTNAILLGTSGGLLKFEIKANTFTKIPFNDRLLDGWPSIHRIFKDKVGQLWLGMAGRAMGLLKYNYEARSYKQYRSNPSDPTTISHNVIMSIGEDTFGRLWIGTFIGGLNLLNRSTDKFQSFQHNSLNKKSIGSQWINLIFEDKDQNLWIGTGGSGVSSVLKYKKPLVSYTHNTEDLSTLASGEITAMQEDVRGDLWISHFGGGVSRLRSGSNKFIRYGHDKTQKININNEWVLDIYEDREGEIWLGLVARGLDRVNPNTNSVIHYYPDVNNTKSLGSFGVSLTYEDNQQRLWLGLGENGLDLFDKKENTFRHFKHNPADPTSICNGNVKSIFHDNKDFLWIGTSGGLCRLDLSQKNEYKFFPFKNDVSNQGSISNDIILSIFQDSKERLWIGTYDGLNLFNYENESFTHFTIEDGLPDNFVCAILEDDTGNIWFRTEKKIVKFYVENNSFIVYDESDGFSDCRTSEINYKAFHKGRSGKFYYGGKSSLTVFYPDSIKDNPNPPPIVLTDFKLRNKSVEVSDSSYLKKNINSVDLIELPHQENIFSIEFAALDYTTPDKNKYAYVLEGFNDDWTYTDSENRIASYTNLDPGDYVFRVKGSNCDGVWNEVGASVKITILPPWWGTWWFRSIASLYIISMLVFLYKQRTNHLKSEKKKQELFSQKLIESQEEERKRIAGELHDSLGQNLMIIYNEVQQYFRKNKSYPKDLENLAPEVKESIEEVREIARNLHPYQIDQLGLTKAIESMIKRLDHSSEIKFSTNLDFIDDNIVKDSWIHIYRIIQEALTNIIKHSKAIEAIIKIKKNHNNIEIQIYDNGIGFNTTSQNTNHGFGIQNMKERARLLNAKLEINSQNNRGLKVLIIIPT